MDHSDGLTSEHEAGLDGDVASVLVHSEELADIRVFTSVQHVANTAVGAQVCVLCLHLQHGESFHPPIIFLLREQFL